MEEPRIPLNEEQRMEAVHALDILDTAPEEAFDRITRMAARIMGVPIACVTVVDKDRQWFKSRVGLDVEETERRVSFCGHAIHSESLFVVTNAHDDPRFADNPLVTSGPNIAFYMGIPVMSPDGYPVGTLCAIDSTPHSPSESQQALMADLAKLVESELRLRHESTTDMLSGLMNRRLFNRIAECEISRAARTRYPLSIVLIDLDHFKHINDVMGHQVGDQVIAECGNTLSRVVCRAGDAVARLGGDEFIAVLVDTNAEGARYVASRLLKGLQKSIDAVLGEQPKHGPISTVSVGVAVVHPGEQRIDLDEIIKAADQALYESKSKGGNTVTIRSLGVEPQAERELATTA